MRSDDFDWFIKNEPEIAEIARERSRTPLLQREHTPMSNPPTKQDVSPMLDELATRKGIDMTGFDYEKAFWAFLDLKKEADKKAMGYPANHEPVIPTGKRVYGTLALVRKTAGTDADRVFLCKAEERQADISKAGPRMVWVVLDPTPGFEPSYIFPKKELSGLPVQYLGTPRTDSGSTDSRMRGFTACTCRFTLGVDLIAPDPELWQPDPAHDPESDYRCGHGRSILSVLGFTKAVA